MKHLFIISAVVMLTGVASAQQTIQLSASTGEEAVFEMTRNDADKVPAFYASALLFNNTGFSGRTGTCAGAGANIQYTYRGRVQLNGYWVQGLVNTSPSASGSFVSREAGAAWYFSKTTADADKTIRMKSDEHLTAHVFDVPAKVSRLKGVRAAFSASGVPLDTYTTDNQASRAGQVNYASTSSFIVGVTLTETSCFEVSSPEYGSKLHCVKNTFYADVLGASSTNVEFTSVPVTDENLQALQYARYGARIGYERIAVLKRSGLGSFYRLEAGYRPGLKEHDAGVYMKFHAGICLGYK